MTARAPAAPPEAPRDCALCPRLVAYREENRRREPSWFNGAAPSFGDVRGRVAIVGLAPGRTGANRTGRPFTGDYAGELLYATLEKVGLSQGVYRADPADGFMLVGALVTNAVRCAPPENKPTPAEIETCRPFLAARLSAMRDLRSIVALGRIAHESVLRAYGVRPSLAPFGHGAEHDLAAGVRLLSSYHCSRYNTQTRRLTAEMFEAVVQRAADHAGRGATPRDSALP